MSGHTPGPWSVFDGGRGNQKLIVNEATTIAQTLCGNDKANARLIAAAPELLRLAMQYASECSGCEGRGFFVTYVDPYERGDVSSPERHSCQDCADIRAVIFTATGGAQ